MSTIRQVMIAVLSACYVLQKHGRACLHMIGSSTTQWLQTRQQGSESISQARLTWLSVSTSAASLGCHHLAAASLPALLGTCAWPAHVDTMQSAHVHADMLDI